MPSFEMRCEKLSNATTKRSERSGLQCVTFHGERIVGASFSSRIFLLYIVLSVHNIYRAAKFLDSVLTFLLVHNFCNNLNMCVQFNRNRQFIRLAETLSTDSVIRLNAIFHFALHKVCVVKFFGMRSVDVKC